MNAKMLLKLSLLCAAFPALGADQIVVGLPGGGTAKHGRSSARGAASASSAATTSTAAAVSTVPASWRPHLGPVPILERVLGLAPRAQ